MKRIFLISCILIASIAAKSQTKAITDNGREVVLYDNGSWKYSDDSTNIKDSATDTLKTNTTKFSKPLSANFLVKSKVFNIGVYINPTKWTFSSKKENEKNPEYRFSLKSGEGYVMMVTEKNTIDLPVLRALALQNAQLVSVDVKETSAEYRYVNNKKVLCLNLKGTTKGIKFQYFGYYYSNENGTVQLVGFSTQQYFDSVQKELEKFLNGLVEITK